MPKDHAASHIKAAADRHNVKIDDAEIAKLATSSPDFHKVIKMIDGEVPPDIKAGDLVLRKILAVMAGMSDAVVSTGGASPFIKETATLAHGILAKFPAT